MAVDASKLSLGSPPLADGIYCVWPARATTKRASRNYQKATQATRVKASRGTRAHSTVPYTYAHLIYGSRAGRGAHGVPRSVHRFSFVRGRRGSGQDSGTVTSYQHAQQQSV